MQNGKRKMMLALLMLTMSVSIAYAEDSIQTVSKSVNPKPIDYVAVAAAVVQKLHADATLSVEQQAQIAELTAEYYQERQAILDVPKRWMYSEEVMTLLKEIEDRYQEDINQILSPEQRETVKAQREERKNEMIRDAQVAAKEAAALMKEREQTNEETSN